MTNTMYQYMVQLLGDPIEGFEWLFYIFGSLLIFFIFTLLVRIIASFLTGGRS